MVTEFSTNFICSYIPRECTRNFSLLSSFHNHYSTQLLGTEVREANSVAWKDKKIGRGGWRFRTQDSLEMSINSRTSAIKFLHIAGWLRHDRRHHQCGWERELDQCWPCAWFLGGGGGLLWVRERLTLFPPSL